MSLIEFVRVGFSYGDRNIIHDLDATISENECIAIVGPNGAGKTTLLRLAAGNVSHVKSVGQGVSELKIDFGPGYRVYFGRDGLQLVILLGGGTKKRQQADIAEAQNRWSDYKRRKSGGT